MTPFSLITLYKGVIGVIVYLKALVLLGFYYDTLVCKGVIEGVRVS